MKCRMMFLLGAMTSLINCGGNHHTVPTPLASTNQNQSQQTANTNPLSAQLSQLPLGTLSPLETEGLVLMREEEKLAHDVYLSLYELYGTPIFKNIGDSEQTHTDAVAQLLIRYGIDDPVQNTAIGAFTNDEFTYLYNGFVQSGDVSELEALYVGIEIEELDIYDIDRLSQDVYNNDDILLVYSNLIKGSRNHLRAFYKQIQNNQGSYTPKYISQSLFDEIVNSPVEKN